MKSTLKFYFVTLFLLASDFVAFAQPGDDDDGGGLEGGGGDPQPAPIDSKLMILLILGILFVLYTYRKHKRTV